MSGIKSQRELEDHRARLAAGQREREAAPGKKKRYRVTGTLTITVIADVEAINEQEARDLALDLPVMTLCNHCAGGDPKANWITSGELDGDPEIVEVTHEG